MGPGRSQPARTAPGRPSGDAQRAAAVFRRRHGALHRGSAEGDRHAASRTSPTARRGQDALVRTSPERDGVAQVLWYADLSCSCARIFCTAQIAQGRRGSTGLWPGSQTGKVEVLTMDSQHSLQNKFRFCARNIRNPPSRTANPRRRCRRMPVEPGPGALSRTPECFRSARQLVKPKGEALFVDRSTTDLDQRAPYS